MYVRNAFYILTCVCVCVYIFFAWSNIYIDLYILKSTHTHIYIHKSIYLSISPIDRCSFMKEGVPWSEPIQGWDHCVPSTVAVARAGLAFPQPLGFLLQARARVSGPETG